MTDAQQPIGSAVKDERHLTPAWERLEQGIDGARTREVRHLVTRNGITTELYRKDWGVAEGEMRAMVHVALRPGAVSAWHMHRLKTDHLFTVGGSLRVVLYDDREASRTRGQVDVHHLSPMRPTLVVIPPGVWHGIAALAPDPGVFVNFFDREYDYDDPDDWRLAPDTDEIPYRF